MLNIFNIVKLLKLFVQHAYCIESDLSEISGIPSFTRTLTISGIHITSIKKDAFNKFPKVVSLEIKNTGLKEFPAGLEHLHNLEYIEYSCNDFTENINNLNRLPNQIKDKIRYLDLEGNKLSHLPGWISGFKNLQTLYLDNNNLSYLPESIGELLELGKFSADNNKLESLPMGFFNLYRLNSLELMNNKFQSLDSHLIKLQNLSKLNLSENEFNELPICISMLHRLRHLDMSGNKINTIFPTNENIEAYKNDLKSLLITNKEAIEKPNKPLSCSLKVKMNTYASKTITRIFPFSKEQCNKIVEVTINQEGLPRQLFPNLEYFNLSRNKITEICDNIRQCKRLKHLHASSNSINSISPELFNLPLLRTLNLQKNSLKYIPYFNPSMRLAKLILYLSNNFITPKDFQDKGYGQESLIKMAFYFRSLEIGFQYPEPLTYEEAVVRYYETHPHWIIENLNKIQIDTDLSLYADAISDKELLLMWRKVLKYFVYDSKKDEDYDSCDWFEAVDNREESDCLITKILNSGILKKLDNKSVKCSQQIQSLRRRITEYLKYLFQKNSRETFTPRTCQIKRYIKVLFEQFTKDILEAGDDMSKIENIRVAISNLCENNLVNCTTGQFEGLNYYYTAYFLKNNKTIDNSIIVHIKGILASIKETAFITAVMGNDAQNVHNMYEWRRLLCDKIGISYEFEDPFSINRQQIRSGIVGLTLLSFLKYFDIQQVINEILLNINKKNEMIIETMNYLIDLEKKQSESDENGQFEPEYSYNHSAIIYTNVIQKYFKYKNNTELKILEPVELNSNGLMKILVELQLISKKPRITTYL